MENNKVIYLDENGYALYLKEIEELEERLFDFRMQNAEVFNTNAKEDNHAFEEAVREEHRLTGMVAEKKEGLRRIVIISDNIQEKLVNVNDFVKINLFSMGEDEDMIIKLVASPTPDDDADIPEISINSPLGASIYGKMVGTEVNYVVSGEETKVTIINKSNDLDKILNPGPVLKRENLKAE